MAQKVVITCDGCGSEIDTTKPWLHVNCNLHYEEPEEPRIITGGVVTLAFCKPACPIKWFEEAKGSSRAFKLVEPKPTQADPDLIPVELRERES